VLNQAEPLDVDGILSSGLTQMYLINLYFPDTRGEVNGVRAGLGNIEGKGFDVLIGMDVITLGDFAISNYQDRTVFSFRYPSIGCIDFAKEWNKEKGGTST